MIGNGNWYNILFCVVRYATKYILLHKKCPERNWSNALQFRPIYCSIWVYECIRISSGLDLKSYSVNLSKFGSKFTEVGSKNTKNCILLKTKTTNVWGFAGGYTLCPNLFPIWKDFLWDMPQCHSCWFFADQSKGPCWGIRWISD